MPHIPELPLLAEWQSFYMIIGTAAATLTGLMFVATSLVVGAQLHLPTLNAGIDAFNTPTVVHFGAVLLIAGVLSVPWSSFAGIRFVLGAFGLAMVIYLVVILRRMRRITHYQPPLRDWLWYVVFPLIAYVVLLAAAMALPAAPATALYVLAAALLVLLFIGIRNAWDLVTFLAVVRSQAEDTAKK